MVKYCFKFNRSWTQLKEFNMMIKEKWNSLNKFECDLTMCHVPNSGLIDQGHLRRIQKIINGDVIITQGMVSAVLQYFSMV